MPSASFFGFAVVWMLASACSSIESRSLGEPGGSFGVQQREKSTRARGAEAPRERRHDLTFVLEEFEPDRVDVDTDAGNGSARDVERRSTRLRYRTGRTAGGFYVGLVHEEVETAALAPDDELDLYGIELGGDGFVRAGPEHGAAFAFDWSVGASTRFGSTDTNDDGVGAFEWTGRYGFGVDFEGLQLATGFAVLAYELRIDDSLDTSFSDFEVVPYARAAFRDEASPVTGNLVFYFGEVEGVSAGFGFHL